MSKNNKQDIQEINDPPMPSKVKIIKASIIAFIVAIAILVVAILPAEYGIDPLGTGNVLGLTDLSKGKTNTSKKTNVPIYKAEQSVYKKHSAIITLGPREGQEFKFKMEEGAGMLYSWESTAPLAYEFHGDREGAPQGVFESYEKTSGNKGYGSFTAPFTGRHGWYWENTGNTTVTINLTTDGFYTVIGNPKKPLVNTK